MYWKPCFARSNPASQLPVRPSHKRSIIESWGICQTRPPQDAKTAFSCQRDHFQVAGWVWNPGVFVHGRSCGNCHHRKQSLLKQLVLLVVCPGSTCTRPSIHWQCKSISTECSEGTSWPWQSRLEQISSIRCLLEVIAWGSWKYIAFIDARPIFAVLGAGGFVLLGAYMQ